jgi:hypothetical protein
MSPKIRREKLNMPENVTASYRSNKRRVSDKEKSGK